ncbi:ribonuclease inhibitor [Astyanax mexicanus]|uniref:ribonuclease inhibitor n=1 Tax=Astyanax mexicanus TaxID=7994 RepID=UPI0020CAA309|nr:ribonuclease inhibitor [Astyanax mexicanus]
MQYVWVVLLFLPSALSQSTGRFRVVVPEAPVSSVSGSDVVLSCSVREFDRPNILVNAVDLNVTWSRSDLNNSLVHLYGNHKDLNTDQIPSYRGRTAVFKEQLKNGDVSLNLSNVRITDEGEYTCRVDSTTWKSDKTIKLSVKEFVPSETGKTDGIAVGITIVVLLLMAVPAGILFHFYNEKKKKEEEIENEKKKKEEEIENVTSLLYSDKDGHLQHHNLSPRQWDYVEETLLKSKEELKEFNLRKYDPSERGVEKLQKVIASSEKALLKQCNLTEKSCEVLASVLSSENSLTELDLSLNKLQDSGVKKLCEGLKSSHCKLQNLRLEECDLTEKSCAVLAEVLQSGNSKLIELHLSENRGLKDSGVKNLCNGLKDKNCKLEKLWLKQCDLGEKSCVDLASVLRSENSKLIELNLSENPGLKDSGVEKLCDGWKDKNCKLEILRLEYCNLTEYSCVDLASVLRSGNSKLIELNLSQNRGLNDAGVEKLCEGLKNENCKLQILGLAECSITVKGFTALASALHPSSPLEELDLSRNELKESEQKLLPVLRTKFPKLKVKLAKCSVTDEGCAARASENHSSPLKEQDLSSNDLKESEQKLLPDDDTFV